MTLNCDYSSHAVEYSGREVVQNIICTILQEELPHPLVEEHSSRATADFVTILPSKHDSTCIFNMATKCRLVSVHLHTASCCWKKNKKRLKPIFTHIKERDHCTYCSVYTADR